MQNNLNCRGCSQPLDKCICKVDPAKCTEIGRSAYFAATGMYSTDDVILKWIRGENESNTVLSTQVGGDHYQLPIQPIDYIVKNSIPFREGNAIKYITRHATKNGAEDIKKAIHYLEMVLEDYKNVTQP